MKFTKIEKEIRTVYCDCSLNNFEIDFREKPEQQSVSYETLRFTNDVIKIENENFYYVRCPKCKTMYVK